jgi:hypothetical protein
MSEVSRERQSPASPHVRLDWINTSADHLLITMRSLVGSIGTLASPAEMVPHHIRAIDATIDHCNQLAGHRTRIKHLRSARRHLTAIRDRHEQAGRH